MTDEQKSSESPASTDAAPAAAAAELPAHEPYKPKPAAWGEPLWKVDIGWTKFETWLTVVLIALELLALTAWVMLKGLSTPADSGSSAGWVFRAFIGGTALGVAPYLLLKKYGYRVQTLAGMAGAVLGIMLAKSWLHFGVDYTSNLLNWYQQASSLTLFGGLRGVGTRITLVLAILGGSLATARGKHITIDLVQRFAPERVRLPVVVAGWLISAAICLVCAWGFFDHIAIENFGADASSTRMERVKKVGHELEEGFFIWRKQLTLDLKATPHVVFRGEVYADWLSGREWNEWLANAGFAERYGPDSVKNLEIAPDDTRAPMIVIPGRGEPRGELIHAASLAYPFGFLVIALRFLLRSALALSRHVSVDPDDSGDFSEEMPEEAKA